MCLVGKKCQCYAIVVYIQSCSNINVIYILILCLLFLRAITIINLFEVISINKDFFVRFLKMPGTHESLIIKNIFANTLFTSQNVVKENTFKISIDNFEQNQNIKMKSHVDITPLY